MSVTTITPDTYFAIPKDMRSDVDAWINTQLQPYGFDIGDCVGLEIHRRLGSPTNGTATLAPNSCTIKVVVRVEGMPTISDDVLTLLNGLDPTPVSPGESTAVGDDYRTWYPHAG